MKSVLICVAIALAVYVTSSQPTCDDCGVSDCGCQKELEVLQNQIIMLNKKIDSILNNGKTTGVITHNLEIWVKGHSRSLETEPLDRLYTPYC